MRALAVSLLALLTLAAPAAAQDVARLDRPSPISAHAGWLAWSARGADGLFHLTLRDPQGLVSTPPIAGRATSFDVDLGPGAEGLVATYSRCREEVPSAGGYLPADYDEGDGCDVYLLDVAGGSELRVNGVSTGSADETWPTVWRDEIAFVRSYDGKPTLPYLYARPLAGGASQRLPGGTRHVCTRSGRREICTDERVSRPYALDLYGRRLAFGWTYAGRSEGLDTEIRLDTIGDTHARIAYQAGGGLTGRALGWPSFESGRVYFSEACYADTSGCIRQPELQRYRISTRTTEGADADKAILGHERDSGVDWLLIDEASGTDCQGDPAVPGGTCVLRGVRPPYR
ncbi:MAG: hypothetical protein QOI64_1797 [Solirubrobacteraceae bacterium]|nr:hypothetical protein [Solirubrobacteraceae bacterium]